MANELKMAIVESILQLRSLHWSARRIARELGIDRGTVAKHLRRSEMGAKLAIPPAGSASTKGVVVASGPGDSQAVVATPPGAAQRGRPSGCVPYRAIILDKLELALRGCLQIRR